MIILIILLLLIIGAGVFVIINLFKQIDALEKSYDEAEEYVNSLNDYVSQLNQHMTNAYERMVQVDRKGAFEADDEVGYIFSEIKQIITEINNKYIDNE
jgi:predicted PurR-regulated permease PerM